MRGRCRVRRRRRRGGWGREGRGRRPRLLRLGGRHRAQWHREAGIRRRLSAVRRTPGRRWGRARRNRARLRLRGPGPERRRGLGIDRRRPGRVGRGRSRRRVGRDRSSGGRPLVGRRLVADRPGRGLGLGAGSGRRVWIRSGSGRGRGLRRLSDPVGDVGVPARPGLRRLGPGTLRGAGLRARLSLRLLAGEAWERAACFARPGVRPGGPRVVGPTLRDPGVGGEAVLLTRLVPRVLEPRVRPLLLRGAGVLRRRPRRRIGGGAGAATLVRAVGVRPRGLAARRLAVQRRCGLGAFGGWALVAAFSLREAVR